MGSGKSGCFLLSFREESGNLIYVLGMNPVQINTRFEISPFSDIIIFYLPARLAMKLC